MTTRPSEQTNARQATAREQSPAAVACTGWFRKLARALKVSRLYKTENAVVSESRDQVIGMLEQLIIETDGLSLRITPTEILLGNEVVVRQKPKAAGEEAAMSSGEEQLPFLFYRDGIRGIRLPINVPRAELEALFDALRAVGGGPASNDDLVTLLWQANLSHIQIESAALEQTIYLTGRAGVVSTDALPPGQVYAWSPLGSEIRTDLGMKEGGQGLHHDTFDDWELADTYAQVPQAYEEMLPTMEYSLSHFRAAWEEENSIDWTQDAPVVLRQILELDPTDQTRQMLSHAVVTWIGSAFQRSALAEAQRAVELLREFDPERIYSDAEIASVIAQLDHGALVEYLDEAEPEEQARFAALAVGIGKPCVDLTYSVMSKCTKARTRAAACTVLCYQCADEPKLLAPYIAEAQGEALINLVFTLGQIGGPDVVDLLHLAAAHPEPRVRRQVVQALGGVPQEIRIPILIQELKTQDPQLLAAVLQMLTREKNAEVSRGILAQISTPEFETRNEDVRWSLFNSLALVADDEAVPELAKLLNKGGWFARKTFTRSAAARTLAQIGSRKAMAVLEAGRKSPAAAVRHACREVTQERKKR